MNKDTKKIDEETFGTEIFCPCGKHKFGIAFNIVLESFEVWEK